VSSLGIRLLSLGPLRNLAWAGLHLAVTTSYEVPFGRTLIHEEVGSSRNVKVRKLEKAAHNTALKNA